jgi:sec-independent protein translocase protein TatA
MLGRFGTAELLIVALILILFFGGRKIPEFIRGLGEALREFRKGAKEE